MTLAPQVRKWLAKMGRETGQHVPAQSLRLPGFALLLAAGVFAPSGVGAHPCPPGPDGHKDFQSTPVPCSTPTHQKPTHVHSIEVEGGRYREMTLKADVPSDDKYYDEANDSIVITFHRSFDLPSTETLTARIEDTADLITVDDNVSGANPVPVNGFKVSVNGKKLTLTGRTYDVNEGENITITIKEGANIETPETPQGFDDFEDEEPYEVFISFVDGGSANGEVEAEGKNFVIVKNPIDSTVPNTSVRVELHTHAEAHISTADDISVDFSGPSADSGFDLPSTLATSRIKVFYGDGTKKSFNPSEVQVEGERVIFSVPANKDESQISFLSDYRIEFSKLARIRTPFSAGIKTIRVSSSVDGDEDDIIEAVVRRTTTVSPKGAPRGSEFTLEGKGYAPGTVTVYHDADGDDTIDAGETLASVKTVRGAFRTKLTARGSPGEAKYEIRARDSEGDDVSVGFDIRSAMSFEPNPVGLGSSLKIIISDWEEDRNEVVAVQIAGKEVFIVNAVEYNNCIDHPNAVRRDSQGKVTFTVDVPSDIPPGEQTVAVYDHYQLDYENAKGDPVENKKSCHELDPDKETWGGIKEELKQAIITDDPIAITKATVEIAAWPLTLSQSEAVRGQRVTISGSGFTQSTGDDIISITINGEKVAEEPSQFEVSHDGTVAFTVTVPLDVRTGENEVQVTGWDNTLGTGTLTVPEPSITVDPPQGRRGERITVTGSGFAANGIFLVSYGDETAGAGQSDARGNFEVSFPVPVDADIGRTYRVTAVMKVELGNSQDPIEFEAVADHSPPAATVTISPDLISPGDRMTIRGENLPAFALVRPVQFANRDFTPVPNISTSRNGTFEMEILLQGVEPDDHQLRVEVSGVVITQVVQVAPPPLSGPPKHVLKELINAGALLRVWYLERSTQEWFFFDPDPEIARYSNLLDVKRSEIYWMQLSAPHEFQGDLLVEGWNLVRLQQPPTSGRNGDRLCRLLQAIWMISVFPMSGAGRSSGSR